MGSVQTVPWGIAKPGMGWVSFLTPLYGADFQFMGFGGEETVSSVIPEGHTRTLGG